MRVADGEGLARRGQNTEGFKGVSPKEFADGLGGPPYREFSTGRIRSQGEDGWVLKVVVNDSCLSRGFLYQGLTSATAESRGEGGREAFVEVKEEFEALAFGGEGLGAIAAVDGAVELFVGAAERAWRWGHRGRRGSHRETARGRRASLGQPLRLADAGRRSHSAARGSCCIQ